MKNPLCTVILPLLSVAYVTVTIYAFFQLPPPEQARAIEALGFVLN
jgi:hypothetical protein